FLLAHKCVATSNYNSVSSLNDTFWADSSYSNQYDYGDHSRDPTNAPPQQDPATEVSDQWGDLQTAFTSPHAGAMPVLMTDGSVRMYGYTYVDPNYVNIGGNSSQLSASNDTFAALFAWNRPIPISPP
ncbi:MAG TPA: DUF1559 domain-containing protein, partial [Gemmataceae bacterium]